MSPTERAPKDPRSDPAALIRALAARAMELATERKHAEAGVVHLAAALLEYEDAQEAVEACGAELEVVLDLVAGTVDEARRRSWWWPVTGRSRVLEQVLRLAVMHAVSAEVPELSAAHVLADLLVWVPDAPVVERLDALGVEALPMRRWVSHGTVDETPIPTGSGRARVVFHNDPFTTMELVVEVLETHFALPREAAMQLMRRVHYEGRGHVAPMPWGSARQRLLEAREAARREGFPLELTIEPAGGG